MERLSTEDFLAWATTKGLGHDPQYPHSSSPRFLTDTSTWYRIRPSEPREAVEIFVGRALQVAAAGTAVTAFPPRRGGTWAPAAYPDHPGLEALERCLADVGLPRDYVGALRFGPAELAPVTRAVAAAVTLDSLWQLTVVPEHGACALRSDEDGDLLADFPDDGKLASYLAALANAGWREPTSPDPRVSATDPWLDLPERRS